jgi:hypothetical protein
MDYRVNENWTAFWDYLNHNAGGVTAIATIALAALTGLYVIVTGRQAKHLKDQALQMRKQVEQLLDQDRKRVRRAIQSIVTELKINHQNTRSDNPVPLLSDAYPVNLWALQEVSLGGATLDAIARAHVCTKHFNLHHVADAGMKIPSGESNYAWADAAKAADTAVQAVNADRNLQDFLRSSHNSPDNGGEL